MFLGILLGVQTVIVVALFARISELDARLEEAVMATAGTPGDPGATAAIEPDRGGAGAGLSENEIRVVIREELAPLNAALTDLERDSGAVRQSDPVPLQSPQTDRIYQDVRDETRRLIAKGSASEAEMAALEYNIAQLPPAQRNAALSEISRAVSNGSLKARF